MENDVVSRLRSALAVLVALSALALSPMATTSGAAVVDTPAGLQPIEPCVILDTRDGTGPFAGPVTPGSGNGMVLDTRSGTGGSGQGGEICDIPFGTDYSAVMVLVEALNVTTPGNLRVFPTGETASGGVVNYGLPGFENSNVVIVPVNDLTQRITIEANVGAVDARLTVLGYLEPDAGYEYTPVNPCAFADSRSNQGPVGDMVGPYSGNDEKTVRLAGFFGLVQGGGNSTCKVPVTTELVLVNLVAINSTGDGTVGIREAGSSEATTHVHFEAYDPPMNNSAAVWVPLSFEGELELFTRAEPGVTTEVRAVVLGYADDNEITDGSQYVPVTPCAAFDSRVNQGADGAFAGLYDGGERRTMDLVGSFDAAQGGGNTDCGVPQGATAVHLNLVAINAVAPGNLRAFAPGSEPAGGVVNFVASGTNNSNGIIVPLSPDGRLSIEVNAGPGVTVPTTEVRGVVLGYLFDLDRDLEVFVTWPTNDQSVVPSPVTIEGVARGAAGVASVELRIRDALTNGVSYPVGSTFLIGPEDLDYRHPATLSNPGEPSTTFTVGPIDLDLEGSGYYQIEPIVTAVDGSIAIGPIYFYRTITSPAPTGTIEAPLVGAEVSQPFQLAGRAEAPAGVFSGFIRIRTVDTGQYLALTPLQGVVQLTGPQTESQLPLVIVDDRWVLPQISSGLLAGLELEVDQLVLVNNNGVSAAIPMSHRFVVGEDTTNPIGAIKSPRQDEQVPVPLEVAGTAEDSVGVESVDVSIQRTDDGQWWNGSQWQAGQVWLDAVLDDPGFASSAWTFIDDPADGVASRERVEISLRVVDLSGNISSPADLVRVTLS